ncbi:MAG TPA: DUF748 domain-containing protein [Steroidobacteraceae bacterium]|jgi:hypothetical protein|nr:DUF748 domain-containing protein [Steroidobacteraceae bacterium]
MTRRNKILVGLGVLVVVLVAARLALPYAVKDYTNRKLATLESYEGHVGDIDIHLWRGAYSIDDIVIVKKGAKRPVPFFRARRTDFSVEWRSLMRGSVVATAAFDSPELNLVQAKSEKESQLGDEEDWHALVEQMFPFRFNTVQVSNGTVRFLAPGIETKDAITARKVNGHVSNLTNVIETGKETFADFRIEGQVLDGAPAYVAGSIDAFARQPTFDVNMEVKKVQLPQVNPWLREYIKADAEAGRFELYMEMAAADGKFKGYAKPILEDVDMYRSGEPEKNPLKRVWEGFLDFAANVLENKDADQVAARIPFTGTIEDPKTNLFATIASVLRNAFVSAFARSLEGSITLRDVKKNLQGIDPNQESGEKGDKKKDEKKDEKKDKKADDKRDTGPAGKS